MYCQHLHEKYDKDAGRECDITSFIDNFGSCQHLNGIENIALYSATVQLAHSNVHLCLVDKIWLSKTCFPSTK